MACASTSKQSAPGEYVDDSVITTKVKSALAVDKAGETAKSVGGVKSVKNNLIVKK